MTHLGGIDLGGTKIEARLFDEDLNEVDRRRIPTPRADYQDLLDALDAQMNWLDAQSKGCLIGVGAPGLINPQSGVIFCANLPASGQMLRADLSQRLGRPVSLINDCRAFTLSEALMGAGQPFDSVMGLVIGTGVAGGYTVNGHLASDLNGGQGEYGHLPMPASLVERHNLPVQACACGSIGCFETFLSGPGLSRLSKVKTGHMKSPQDILQSDEHGEIVEIWVDMAGELLNILTRIYDPEAIVLGGGLGMHPGLPDRLSQSLAPKMLANTRPPVILQAQGGDASGAIGAALFAKQT